MQIVEYSKAIADETRLRLINLLRAHELAVGEIVEVLGIPQPKASRHLRVLVEAGLAAKRRDGLRAFYRAADDGRAAEFLLALSPFLAEGTLAEDLRRGADVVERRRAATVRFFDEVAEDWRTMSAEVLGEFDLVTKLVEELSGCGVVADLGCGPGDLLAALQGRTTRLIGVDNAHRMLATAGERLGSDPATSLRLGEASHLPLGDGEADCAVYSLVLHHLPDPSEALGEAARVVRTGGKLVVADFVEHDVETMRTRFGDHRLGFPRQDMAERLEAVGFAVKRTDTFAVRMGLEVFVMTAQRARTET
jgi:ArsR family transcriptional regulator